MGVATQIAQHPHGTTERGLGIDNPVVAMETTEQFCELPRIGESRSRAHTVAYYRGGGVSGRQGTSSVP